jgi:hypothetical protein
VDIVWSSELGDELEGELLRHCRFDGDYAGTGCSLF